jgi:hypothetical protein
MQVIAEIAQVISIACFGWYGISCFLSRRMIAEFERYRLPQIRFLTGTLQVCASLGLTAGHFYRPLLLASAGGLAAMMLVGLLVRWKIRDPLYASIPAFSLIVLNGFIVAAALLNSKS